MMPALPAYGQEGQKVAQIVITGNQNINKETIANVVKLAPGAQYTKEAADKDREAISAIGYFSAVSVRTEETPEGLRVIYDVAENPVVKEIKIVGAGPVPEPTISKLIRTQAGQVLNTETLKIDIDAIQRYYRDKGYIAYVTEDIGIDSKTGDLTIPILVHTVASVDIVGNKKTRESVFVREMKTRPGRYFNMKVLHEDVARILNLDLLDDVEMPKIEPAKDVGKVNVVIPVKEKKTGEVRVGLGYSNRSRLVGRAELTETNLRGRGQGLTLLWETTTTENALGGSASYEVGFYEPWIDKKHTSLSFNVFNKLLYRFSPSFIGGTGTVNGQTYNERRKGGTFGLSRPFTDFTRAFVTLRSERVHTSDIPTTGTTGLISLNGPIRSGTIKLLNNTRDFDKDPAVGWYKSVSVELGSADVIEKSSSGSRALKGPFRKLQIDIRHYWSRGGRKMTPTDKRTTIAARILLGVSSGDIPFFEQYFVGGADTLRGYREDRFWGDRMAVASIEYRKPFGQSLTGVLFADYGDAWAGRSNILLPGLAQHSGFLPSFGTGVGLRVNTAIGSLRLDYGIGREGARTHFSIGHTF
jgi:outer membrane protein insertion porin family